MSLLNKYVQKYGNYDQVKRLQKSKDWMPQTPSSAEKESNVAAAHQYMDSLTDDDRKRIEEESPLGKSLGMQNTITLPFGFGKDNAQRSKEYQTYKAAEDILKNEAYEKKREDVVRKNGSYAYKTMKDYIGLIDESRQSRQGGGTLGAIINAGKTEDLQNQAKEIKKTLEKMGITGKDFDVYEQYVREYKDIEDTQAMEKEIASDIGMKPVSRGIGYTAADILASPVSGLMATAESLKRPFYADPSAPVNTYSDLYRLQNASEAVEQSVSNRIDSKLGKFAYGAGVSTLKSAEAMAIGNYLSGALGIDAASKLGQLTTLPMFGASAFASTLADAQKKGYSAELATEKALASGVAEMLFEELSLDKAWGTLKNAKAGKGGLAKRILDVFMGAGIEGSEEVFTDLANHIADNFISGDFSDYQSGIRMRVEAGQSLDQATKEAKKEFIAQLVESGLAGAASGGLMNVGAATVGSVNYHNTAKNINANSELKREVVESAKGLKDTTAAEIANKKIEEITENDMVEILHSMEEVTEKSAHDIAKESLVRMGESEEEAEKKASAIVEAVSEENPTEEQEAKNTKLVEDEKTAEAYADVLKNRVAQNALSDVYENNQKVKQRRSGGVTAMSNGNQIKVYDFADVNKGIVNTSVGAMSLDNVQMGENERRLFKTAYVFDNNNASNAYVNEYKGQNIADYSTAAMRAYTVGASGASFESFLNDPRNASVIASVDNNAFLQEMYFHGQNTIKKEDVAKVSKSAKAEAKATTQSDLQNVFNEVAKVFNINISETATGEESGAFIPSSLKLTLNQNESKNLYQTLHHELMEYSKAYAPKEYNELKSAIMDFATQKLGSPKVKMHLDIYKDTYRGFGAKTGNEAEAKKTLADATDEYVNDFVAMVMSTDDGVNQFVNYLADNSDLTEQQKTGIIQSLKDFIQKLIDSIKAFIAKHKGMNLGAADAKALTEYTEELAQIRDKIQSAWDASRAEVIAQLVVNNKEDVTEHEKQYNKEARHSVNVDTEGRKLSPEQAKFFKNSKARMKDGSLMVLYHGTEQPGFTTFGNAKNWFTSNRDIAASYSASNNFVLLDNINSVDLLNEKLEKTNISVVKKDSKYVVYQKSFLKTENVGEYKRLEDVIARVNELLDEDEEGRVYETYINVENPLEVDVKGGEWDGIEYNGKIYATYELADYAKENGYDGLILRNIVDIGPYPEYSEMDSESDIVVAFDSNQVKSIDNKKPTKDKDIRYSVNVDSEGKTLTEDQAEYFKDSKVRDEQGRLKVMYHGTPKGGFTVFDSKESYADKKTPYNWYSDNKEVAKSFLKGEKPQIYVGYINAINPYVVDAEGASWNSISIPEEMKNSEEGRFWNWNRWTERKEVSTELIAKYAERNGYDSVIIKNVGEVSEENPITTKNVVATFNSNQFKNIDNLNPTSNEDIRYSVNVDSEGNELTEDQVKFYSKSKIRDNENHLKQMYHGTNNPIFTVFDPEYSDDKLSLFFSDDPFISSTYVAGQRDRKVTPGEEEKTNIEDEDQAIEWLKKHGFDNFKIEEIENPFGSSYSAWTFTDSNGAIYTVSEDGGEGLVDYVKDKQQYEEGGGLYHVYLNIKNPYVIDAEGHNWNDIFMPEQAKDKDLMKKVYRLIHLMKNYVDRGYGIGQLSETLGDLKYSVEYAIEEFGIEEDEDYRDDAKEMRKLAAEIDEIYEKWDEDAHLDEDDDPTPMDRYIVNSDEKPRTTRYIARWAYNHGFDGVYIKNVVDIGGYGDYEKHPSNIAIAFESNQVKSVDNLHPTEDKDIRFSLEVEDWDKLFSEMTEVKESNRILAEGLKSIDNVKLNKKITDKIASEIKSEYKSRIDKKVLSESLEKVFSYMLDTGSPSYGDLAEIMREVAMPVIEQATEVMAEEKRMYDAFKEKMKGYRIKLNAKQKAEVAQTFGSYYAFKNALFGNVVFSESGSELDSIWQSVVEASDGMLDIGTSDANQPMALYEFIQGLKPSYRNIYGADQEEAAYDVALSIFRKFLLEQEYENNPKLRQEALKLNEAHQKYRKTLKQNSDKRIKEAMDEIKIERQINIKRLIREINELNEEESNVIKGSIEQAFIVKQKEQYERRLKSLREYKNEQMDKKLAELRLKQRDSQTKRIQSRQITQAKAKIRKNIEKLNSMLAHGTEKRHVPINMVRATIEMLEAIDINTGNSKSLAKYLEKMDNIYTGLKGAEAYAFDYDARTAETIKTLKKLFDGRNYTMLTLDELNQVVDITKQLVTQIENANKIMLDKKKLDAIEFSKQAIKEVREAKGKDNKFMTALDKYLTPHLNAYREFRKISGYTDGAIMELYKDLDKGQLKQLQVMKDINALFDDVLKNTKEVKAFTSTDEKDLVDSGLRDEKGNPVMITKAQRMALIMSSYNERNMEHITFGGVKVPDVKQKKREDALAKGKTYWYESPVEIRDAIYSEDADKLRLITDRASMKVKELEKGLSPWEKEFLDKVKEMFWHKTGSWINKTSLELKGYALARVNNYFPIVSDKNFVNQDVGGLVQDGTLEGWGNLKERKFGRNAIVLEDITDTILRQTNDVAKYVGLVVPIRNLNVAWNTNVYDVTTATRHTLKEAMDVWGANNKKYIENLIKDMTSRRDGGEPTFLDALRGRFAGAVLTLNPSVAIKQTASYFTAGAIVGNKTLAKTVKDIGKGFITKKGIPELEAINPLLWYRNQGNATQELADMKKTGLGKNLPTWMQKALNWVEFMDTGTVRTLEYAAKNYVDDHYIGANKLEGEEYWQKVSEVFTKIVEETQPNYTPLQQADIIRNPNKAMKMLVMFKTQPLQNFGVLYDSIGELKSKVAAKDQEGIKSAKKKVARAVVSQIQSAMTFSMMTILADLLLHKYYKYKDDDDKFSWDEVLAKFGAGITDSFWGMLLFGQDLYKAVDSFINGEKVNGLNVSYLENIANFANAIQKLYQESQKRLEAITEEDKQKYDNGIIIDTGNVINYFGQIVGLPTGNIKNMAESLILYSMDVRDGKVGESEFSRDVDTQNQRMYDALVANDSERYHKLFDEAVLKKTEDGTDQDKAEESVESGIKKLIQKGYGSGELTFDEAYTILTKEMGMDETDAYFKLDEWLYKSEGNDSYSRYSRVMDAIDKAISSDDRKDMLTEIKKLMDQGVEAKNIQSQITKEYKAKYLELKAQKKSATLKSILISAYTATGLSREDAEKRIDKWK